MVVIDVYKRQAIDSIILFTDVSYKVAIFMSLFMMIVAIITGIYTIVVSVSYTHLDVYKRQTISFVGILILQAINDIYLYTQMDKSILNHFSNIPISSTLQARIIEVDAYIKDEERDVYILDSEAAVYMLSLIHICTFNCFILCIQRMEIKI